MSLRDRILTADDLPREPADVPWDLDGEKVYVRALAFADYQPLLRDGEIRIDGEVMADLVCRTLVTEDGERILSNSDVEALAAKNAQAIIRLFTQVMRLSGLNDEGAREVTTHFGEARSDEPSTG